MKPSAAWPASQKAAPLWLAGLVVLLIEGGVPAFGPSGGAESTRSFAVRFTGEMFRPLRPASMPEMLTRREREVLHRAKLLVPELRPPGDQVASASRADRANDLGAAFTLRALRHDQPEELLTGFRLLDEALRLEPSRPEALFNRALLLEELGLRRTAVEAWQRYLQADERNGWHREAAGRMASLQEQLAASRQVPSLEAFYAMSRRESGAWRREVAANPQGWRTFFDEKLVAGVIGESDPAPASSSAESLRQLAATLGQVTGDRQPEDIVDALLARRDEPGWREVHRRYLAAQRLHRDFRVEEALAAFSALEAELRRRSSPLAGWAGFYLAMSQYRLKRYDAAKARLLELAEIADRSDFSALAGRAYWVIGAIEATLLRSRRATDSFERALARFERCGQTGRYAAVASQLAFDHSYFGDERQAWRRFRQALDLAWDFGDKGTLPLILNDAARSLVRSGSPDLALQALQESLAFDRETGDAYGIAEDLWWVALAAHAAGREAACQAAIAEGRTRASALASAEMSQHLLAGFSAIAGAAARERDPAGALGELDAAYDFYRSRSQELFLSELLLERGLALRQLGRGPAARKDFLEGIRKFEETRRRLRDAPQKIVYFNQARDLFDALVAFEWHDANDPWEALAASERGRARTLLEDLAVRGELTGEGVAALVRGLQKNLGQRTRLIAYDFVGNELLVWVIGSTEIHSELRPLPGPLREIVSMRQSARVGRQDLEMLYRALLAGLEPWLAGATQLIFVPDREIATVPFAALLQPSGRYLVQDVEVALAPSLAALRLLEERSRAALRALPTRELQLVALGVGEHGGREMPDLPSAELEARQVAESYPRRRLMVGEAASVENLRALAPEADVLHLATHAISNPANPQAARILLAGSEQTGTLLAEDIAALALKRAPLVVLATCNGALGDTSTSEGRLDLARPFLAAGARAVVASLWKIGDDEAARFSLDFHRHYLASRDASRALRDTQLEWIGAAEAGLQKPAAWAGYQVIGLGAPSERR